MSARTDDTARGNLFRFEPHEPVSSRGQDTWFSATGPGFESPYRYQPSLITHAKVAHRSSHECRRAKVGLALRSQERRAVLLRLVHPPFA